MRTVKLAIPALAALLAVAPAARADTKIGIVDNRRLMEEIEEAKAVAATMEKEIKERQQKLDAKQGELEKLKADYDKQLSVMTDAAKKEKEAELQKRLGELQQLAETMQKEMAAKDGELRGSLDGRIGAVVKEVADAEGISVVLSKDVVAYAAPALDITNEVVRKYNAKFPRKGGAAAAGEVPPEIEALPEQARPMVLNQYRQIKQSNDPARLEQMLSRIQAQKSSDRMPEEFKKVLPFLERTITERLAELKAGGAKPAPAPSTPPAPAPQGGQH